MAQAPRSVRLHYFRGRGIGEPIRLILCAGGIPFEDCRYTVDEFAAASALKEKLPFGQTPALEVDGVFIGQTDSVARLAARLAGLYPNDPLDAARSDMIMVHQAEIHTAIAKMMFDGVPGAPGTKMLPEAERNQRIDAFIEASVPGLLDRLERLAGERHMVGGRASWADVGIFNRLNQLLDRREDVLGPELPRLRAVYDEVRGWPAIADWVREHKDDYTRADAILAA